MPEWSMRYAFTCPAVPQDALTVVSFKGREAVSECYEFEILAAGPKDVDLDAVVEKHALFTISSPEQDILRHGVVLDMDQIRDLEEATLYSIRLAPRFSMLQYSRGSQVFLDKTLPEILESVLKQSRLTDYKLELQNEYPQMEYVCQYNETNFDFMSRWMESRGLYYFFQQSDSGEVLVITDTKTSLVKCRPPSVAYAQVSGLNEIQRRQSLTSWLRRRSAGAAKVRLKDYNYLKPSLDLTAQTDTDSSDLGENYTYGEGFSTLSEGRALAQVRTEELACLRDVFTGESLAVGLEAGCAVKVEGHPRSACNGWFHLLEVKHEGHQAGRLPNGLQRLEETSPRFDYQAVIKAIPATTQYRPKRKTPKPGVQGVLHAVVETEGTGKYAMLDQFGRYKVRLPFDGSDKANTKASCWLRKVESYAGSGHGMHFPLLAGTEVLLGFFNGDIDRPFIAWAAPNAESVSQTTNANSTANIIRSAGNNQIVMNDKEGQEYISMWSPYHNSGIAIGSVLKGGGGSIHMKSQGDNDSLTLGDSNALVVGASNSATGGVKNIITLGLSNSVSASINSAMTVGIDLSGFVGYKIALGSSSYSLKETNSLSGLESLTLSGGYASAVSGLAKSAKNALIAATVGAAVSGAGVSLASETDNDGGLKGDGACYALAGGVGLTALGALTSTVASVYAVSLIKSFDAASESTAAAKITLDSSGGELNVNSTVGVAPKLTLAQGPPSIGAGATSPGPLNTVFQMSGQGTNVELTNMSTAKLSMSNGQTVEISVTNPAGSVTISAGVSKVTINNNSITLEKTGGGKTVVDADGASMEMTGGAKASVTATEAKLSSGNDSVSVSGTSGITLQFAGGQMKAGPLSINQAGVVQMG